MEKTRRDSSILFSNLQIFFHICLHRQKDENITARNIQAIKIGDRYYYQEFLKNEKQRKTKNLHLQVW